MEFERLNVNNDSKKKIKNKQFLSIYLVISITRFVSGLGPLHWPVGRDGLLYF
jgi:hypothetical protein